MRKMAHEVRGTSVLRRPERSGDLDPGGKEHSALTRKDSGIMPESFMLNAEDGT